MTSPTTVPGSSPSTSQIDNLVEVFLQESKHRYPRGSDEYYQRVALEQALSAFRRGDYGIGAVAVLVHKGRVYEFAAANAMITGVGVSDHAEARALHDVQRFIHTILEARTSNHPLGRVSDVPQPLRVYNQDENEHTSKLADGVHIYGTLEPCPMCMCMAINSGHTVSSLSAVIDGALHVDVETHMSHSEGAANCIGDKAALIPSVWRNILREQGFEFKVYQGTDENLKELSAKIFLETREDIDQKLASARIGSRAAGARWLHHPYDPSKVYDLDALHRSLIILHRQVEGCPIRAAFVLGTGWKEALSEFNVVNSCDFSDLPALGEPGVSGHAGKCILAERGGKYFLIFSGRRHYYEFLESRDQQHVRTPLIAIPWLTSQLGISNLILTQGVGGISAPAKTYLVVNGLHAPPHANIFPEHTSAVPRHLFAEEAEFPHMDGLFSDTLSARLRVALERSGVSNAAGSYYFWPARHFQTEPDVLAEVRQKGAAVVGKSLLFEGAYCRNLKNRVDVGAVCLVTNPATGIVEGQGPDHELHKSVGEAMAPHSAKALAAIADSF